MRSSRSADISLQCVVGLIALAAPALSCEAQLRVVNYNIARLGGDSAALRDVFIALAEDDKPGFEVAPHVWMFQEVRAIDVAPLQTLLNQAAPPGITYTLATYTTSEFEDGNGGAQAMFYRGDVLNEIASQHDDLATGAGRYTDQWKLNLLGYPASASFYAYSSHLRAGDSAAEAAERLAGVQTIRADADALPQGTHIIYAGDYNFASSSEAAYQAFFAPGNGQAVDALGTGSWAGSSNAIKHSQSPRIVSTPELVGGGMDDRFDQQHATGEWHDDSDLTLMSVDFAYRSLGNDGLHYNLAINNGNNFYYPGELAQSNALADDLFDASDHVPIVVDYRLPALLEASMPDSFAPVIVGALASLPLTIRNAAAPVIAEGADLLQFAATTAGDLSGSASDSIAALDDPAMVPLIITTTEVGFTAGSATVTTSSAMAGGPITLQTVGVVLRHANASFSGSTDVDVMTISAVIPDDAASGPQSIYVPVFNYGYDGLQAMLDIDAVSGLQPPFSLSGGLQTDIGSSPALLTFSIDMIGLRPGLYEQIVPVHVSDEDLPGETSTVIALTLQVTVAGEPITGDVDSDGDVDGLDLALLLGAWGACPTLPTMCIADLDDNGVVNGLDLAMLLAAWADEPPAGDKILKSEVKIRDSRFRSRGLRGILIVTSDRP